MDRRPPRQRPTMIRGADGRLRVKGASEDIGDVWAQQERIRLREAQAEEQKRVIRERLRKERGLIGLAKLEARLLTIKVKRLLFGKQAVRRPGVPVTPPRSTSTATPPATPKTDEAKTVEIKIDFSGLPHPPSLKQLKTKAAVWLKRHRPMVAKVGAAVTVLLVIVGGFSLYGHFSGTPAGTTEAATSNGPAVLSKGTPTYDTVIPAGKSIDALGGWTRITPPDRDPVYAYVDTIGKISVSVSQQPLPADIKRDPADKLKEMAKNFQANDTLNVNGSTAYIGTSAKGPQSVIYSKNDLLILIKSHAPIAPADWTRYLGSLK